MDIVGSILENPAIQAAMLGVGIKVAVEFLKKTFLKVDTEHLAEPYKAPLQLVAIICTFLATAAEQAMQGHLSLVDPQGIVNFVTVALPAYLTAMGIGPVTKSAVDTVKKVTAPK